MNSQEYYLNIRPGEGYPQTVKVSQGDVGRPLLFHLMDGVTPLTIAAGSDVVIHATKPSGLGFTETCSVSGSAVSVDSTIDMTQEFGLFPAEIVITLNDEVLATANFSILVERSPHPEGTTDGVAEDLQDIYEQLDDLKSEISELGGGLSDDVKQALLQIAAKVEYIDTSGPDCYQDLFDALYPPKPATAITLSSSTLSFQTLNATQQLTATLTPSDSTDTVTWSSSDTSIATVDSTGLVTAKGYGTATITATAHTGLTATCSVTVAQATLSSISAVYTQSGTVLSTDTLDSLKSDLVVTAHYADSSSETVSADDYTLSGTLVKGTSTVTVTYGGKTDTFSVTVTKNTTCVVATEGYVQEWRSASSSVVNTAKTYGGITEVYDVTQTTTLYPAGIVPYNDTTFANAVGIIVAYDNDMQHVNHLSMRQSSDNRWAQKVTGSLTEYKNTWTIDPYTKITFNVDTRYLDTAYMYDYATGRVFFAGSESPYFGMDNISEAE